MGVALENARLFDETKRLLTETDQRAAELAIINGSSRVSPQKLDMQAMYDLVGDKIQEIFDAQVVDIGVYDKAPALIHFPYTIERGVRFPDEPMKLIGFRRHVIETGQPLLINRDARARSGRARSAGDHRRASRPKSVLFAPLVARRRCRGVISLQNLDREDAFSQADVASCDARGQPQRRPRERAAHR